METSSIKIKITNTVRALLVFGCICFLPAAAVWAQEQESIPEPETEQQTAPTPQPSIEMREDFSDNELKSFVKANERVTVIQLEAEQTMIQAIEEEGLSVERFNEILEQQRDPTRGGETSAEELQSFNKAAQMILDENVRIEQQMTSSIEEEGIDIETYKQIMLAYQQSPQVQDRVNKMVNGETEN